MTVKHFFERAHLARVLFNLVLGLDALKEGVDLAEGLAAIGDFHRHSSTVVVQNSGTANTTYLDVVHDSSHCVLHQKFA